MGKYISGNGKYGFTHQVKIGGKTHTYEMWFGTEQERDKQMKAQKDQVPDAKNFRKKNK